MDPPENTSLPLFSYGIFKPGQLGYFRIQEYVKDVDEGEIDGKLLERDGLPIFDDSGTSRVKGSVLVFYDDQEESVYEEIANVEPEKQYRWEPKAVQVQEDDQQANVLIGRNPTKGTTELNHVEWDGRTDPLFTDALEVVKDIIERDFQFDWGDKKPFFHLQMAYFLLWSSIERYISLRYGLRGPHGKSIHQKLLRMADEEGFSEALQSIDFSERPKTRITRADRPNDDEKLDPDDPQGSIHPNFNDYPIVSS